MSDPVWETFDGLFEVLHRQGRRVEELEARVVELERRLAEKDDTPARLSLIDGRVAQLQVHVSELRHAAGITEVDEAYEQAQSERGGDERPLRLVAAPGTQEGACRK